MCFVIDKKNDKKQKALNNIVVYKILSKHKRSFHWGYKYKYLKENPFIKFEEIPLHYPYVTVGYHSFAAPYPGCYKFIIPKGSEYYYTIHDGLQYVSSNIKLVLCKPLTKNDCVIICNFPKTYEKACERLGIKMFDERGLTEKEVSLRRLKVVISCINRQYRIEYDWNNRDQEKWFGSFGSAPYFNLIEAERNEQEEEKYKGLYLPFAFAVEYVFRYNEEFSLYWRKQLE
jgi:hypothetical protein